jgi:hypothetical protein
MCFTRIFFEIRKKNWPLQTQIYHTQIGLVHHEKPTSPGELAPKKHWFPASSHQKKQNNSNEF